MGLEFSLSHWENRGSLNPFYDYNVAGGFLIKSKDLLLFCPLNVIQTCLSISRTGQSPIEKAAWNRHFRKQYKACLQCRLTQHSGLLVTVFSYPLSMYNIKIISDFYIICCVSSLHLLKLRAQWQENKVSSYENEPLCDTVSGGSMLEVS